MDTKSILKLTVDLTILFAVKGPGTRLGNQNFSQWRPSTKLQMGTHLQVLGRFKVTAELDGIYLKVVVTNLHRLNLLGRQVMVELGLTDLTGHFMWYMEGPKKLSVGQLTTESPVDSFQKACKQCCQEFPDLFQPELRFLNDFELEVKFKPQA